MIRAAYLSMYYSRDTRGRTLGQNVFLKRHLYSFSSGLKIFIIYCGTVVESSSRGPFNNYKMREGGHTAGLDTIFVQIYMDALPGVPGVSKNQNFFHK